MKELLLEYYNSDPYTVETYHGLKGMTPEQCAEDTWNFIKDSDIFVKDWGYFTVDKKTGIAELTGFFIKPELRNKKTYETFYKDVCNEMPKIFVTSVLAENTKVSNFFEKFGAIQFNKQSNDNMKYFLFKQENK